MPTRTADKRKKIIIIDEAQAVPEIGKILKLMIENIKGITVIATGSSSFDLVNKTGEPLVGRIFFTGYIPLHRLNSFIGKSSHNCP